MKWVNELNSSTFHIFIGCLLAIIYVLIAMLAGAAGHELGEGTLWTVGAFILALTGVGTVGFVGKRMTDSDYQVSKKDPAAYAAIRTADAVAKTAARTTTVVAAAVETKP